MSPPCWYPPITPTMWPVSVAESKWVIQGAAAGAAGESAAAELQLAGTLLGGPVPAGDGLIGALRVAGDPDQVPVARVEGQGVGAKHLLDVLAVPGFEHDEAHVKVGVGRFGPARGHQQPCGRPDAVGRFPVPVAGDEHEVAAVPAAIAAVNAVRRRDQQVAVRAGPTLAVQKWSSLPTRKNSAPTRVACSEVCAFGDAPSDGTAVPPLARQSVAASSRPLVQ